MVNLEKLGLFVILKAKSEKATEVKQFLLGGLELAEQEQETKSWYAFQMDETTFGIFDTFEHEKGREAHLNGKIAEALMRHAGDLLVDFQVADIKKFNVLAAK
ncbi:MAG: antibiotic biosynthesis monooxygenase [Bacteroidota bacterium]